MTALKNVRILRVRQQRIQGDLAGVQRQQDFFSNHFRRAGGMPADEFPCHRGASRFVLQEFQDECGQFFSRRVGLLQQEGGPGIDKRAGVIPLMVIRGSGIRNQNRRQPHRGQFGERGSPRTTNAHGRGAQRQLHFAQKRTHDGFAVLGRVPALNAFEIVDARQMHPLQVRCANGKYRQGLQDQFVDAACPLAAAGDQKHRAFRIQTERYPATPGIARLKLRSHGRARRDCISVKQPSGGGRKPNERLVHHMCQPAVSFTGDDVRLVQKGRGAIAFARQHGRRAGETAHRQHRLRRTRVENSFRSTIGIPKTP